MTTNELENRGLVPHHLYNVPWRMTILEDTNCSLSFWQCEPNWDWETLSNGKIEHCSSPIILSHYHIAQRIVKMM
jgi:hypothetical protein